MGLGNFFGRLSSTMVVQLQKEVFSIHSLLAIVAGTCAALLTLCKSATENYILATIYGFSFGPFVANGECGNSATDWSREDWNRLRMDGHNDWAL